MKADFDNLCKRAFSQGAGIPELNELWGNVFLLQNWLFIARGPVNQPQPYIASRADVCNGQDMIRAFTDDQKLTAFAHENKLVEADGSVRSLAIPVQSVVSWLEGFGQYGIYGVWFNSDTKSQGFYSPLVQLRPVKDHLDKTWLNK
ncbi:MAG TPA: hypothetical protein PKK67_09000 [Cyclobacteriaceae bacterium]|nr:hypothetical protein [Cytophagales bacterium]HMR56168.1 hypothetical protein [Cyclobacteriaceae bacterium]HNT50712.1 hypothetical protein [Cyclobacteriaceae bacterium]